MGAIKKIHCYAASFGDDLADQLIMQYGKKGATVLDPFAGSGTTLVQALAKGMKPIGIDIDPVAGLICRVVTKRYSDHWLESFETEVLARLDHIKGHLNKPSFPLAKLARNIVFSVNGYRAHVPDRHEIDFWFTSKQKAVLASLVAYAKTINGSRKRDIVSCAISSSIIRKWPNTISLAMDIDHSRPHKAKPLHKSIDKYFSLFERSFKNTIRILLEINAQPTWGHEKAEIIQGDCIKVMEHSIKDNTVDLILTSPPYLNAIDYPRAHKFSEWWLFPDNSICKSTNYVGLRKNSQINISHGIETCLVKNGFNFKHIKEENRSMANQMAQYLDDIYNLIKNCHRVLRHQSPAILVLADNTCDGKRVPIVHVVADIMREVGFRTVDVGYRSIKPSRRRYPGSFVGVMRNEAVIIAVK